MPDPRAATRVPPRRLGNMRPPPETEEAGTGASRSQWTRRDRLVRDEGAGRVARRARPGTGCERLRLLSVSGFSVTTTGIRSVVARRFSRRPSPCGARGDGTLVSRYSKGLPAEAAARRGRDREGARGIDRAPSRSRSRRRGCLCRRRCSSAHALHRTLCLHRHQSRRSERKSSTIEIARVTSRVSGSSRGGLRRDARRGAPAGTRV
jgi:hypothetical protein